MSSWVGTSLEKKGCSSVVGEELLKMGYFLFAHTRATTCSESAYMGIPMTVRRGATVWGARVQRVRDVLYRAKRFLGRYGTLPTGIAGHRLCLFVGT
jgi:hypothetical protein